jgi:hypothetical protein
VGEWSLSFIRKKLGNYESREDGEGRTSSKLDLLS